MGETKLIHQTPEGDEKETVRGNGLPYDEAEKLALDNDMQGPSEPTKIAPDGRTAPEVGKAAIKEVEEEA